jgi:hypothetical protein
VTITFTTEPAGNAAVTNRNAEPYNIFSPFSATWVTGVNGSSILDQITTNLAAPAKGYIVSKHVVPTAPSIVTLPTFDLEGTFTMTASATIPSTNSQVGVLFPGSQVVFSGQPLATYTVFSVTPTDVVLTTAYTGTPGTDSAITGGILNLLVDTQAVAVGFPPGPQSPASIVAAINTAVAVFFAGYTGAQFVQIGPATGDVLFILSSQTEPAALPGGFDAVSAIKINQGTVEHSLGFQTFQSAAGTPGAINKPATLLGTQIAPYNITAGLNDSLVFTLNGIQYTASSPGWCSRDGLGGRDSHQRGSRSRRSRVGWHPGEHQPDPSHEPYQQLRVDDCDRQWIGQLGPRVHHEHDGQPDAGFRLRNRG